MIAYGLRQVSGLLDSTFCQEAKLEERVRETEDLLKKEEKVRQKRMNRELSGVWPFKF